MMIIAIYVLIWLVMHGIQISLRLLPEGRKGERKGEKNIGLRSKEKKNVHLEYEADGKCNKRRERRQRTNGNE